MAVYGGSNKNLFAIPKQNASEITGDNPSISSLLANNKYNVQVNDQTKIAQIYKQGELVGGGVLGQTGDVSVGTLNLKTGKFTPDTNRKLLADSNPSGNVVEAELKYFSSSNGIKQVKSASSVTVQKGSLDNGATASKAQANAKTIVGTNVATTDADTLAQQQSAAQAAENDATIKKELEGVKAREKYDQLLIYPEKLNLKYQDCIKISMLQYQKSGLNVKISEINQVPRAVSVNNGTPTVGGRRPITTIVLPIPGGINDSNGVDWQGNELNEITKAFAGIAQGAITAGAAGAEQKVGETSKAAEQNIKGLQDVVASKFIQGATGASGIMQRQYGAIINPNIELLFNGPQLRTFSFIFRLSPRSEKEAVIVKKIIRYFKQGMTPKRSSGYLLLQSPHTFAISYVTKDTQHPYLNRFKECALTQCNVNYTPDGNYMSFNGKERSMTSYELTLQFQELIPLFDDDYGSKDDNIGF